MRKLSFILALIGLFALLSILFFQKPLEIDEESQLVGKIQNQLLYTSSKIIKQTQSHNFILLKLDNNLTLIYSGEYQNFLNHNVSITGTLDNFQYSKIKVLEIKYDS